MITTAGVLQAFIAVVVVVVANNGIKQTCVIAYRPSTYTNAPTSLSYDGGRTITTPVVAASDVAVANYLRKRYGTTQDTTGSITTGIPLNTLYPPRTGTTTTPDSSKKGDTVATKAAAAAAATNNNDIMMHAIRNKWGIDNQHTNEYWFDKRIHTLGNYGFWGAVHAALAPVSTKLIDIAAYDGIDIRKQLSNELSNLINGNSKTATNHGFHVVDLCCGVGFSTRALRDAFPQKETTVIGIDTSPEMVAIAGFITNHLSTVRVNAKTQYNAMKRRVGTRDILTTAVNYDHHAVRTGKSVPDVNTNASNHKTTTRKDNSIEFLLRNAEDTKLPNKSYDLVTIMYAFHEAPLWGRDKILKEARRLLSPGGILAVVDISTDYTPSPTMLQGEPYVKEYQRTIHRQLTTIQGFERPKYRDIVPHHVGMWTLKRSVLA